MISSRLIVLTVLGGVMLTGSLPAVEIIAHRGAMMLAPENTLASQRLAYEFGADYVEVDVRLTRDNIPVNMHDHDLERTTDGTGQLASLTLQQLKQLDAGSWFGPQFTGERVPTIAEVLELAKQYNRKVLLHIHGAFMAPEVVAVIHQSGIAQSQLAFLTGWAEMAEGYTRRLPGVKMLRTPAVLATGAPIAANQLTGADLASLRLQKTTTLHFGSGSIFRQDVDRIHAAGFSIAAIYLPPAAIFYYQDLGIDYFWTDYTDVTTSALNRLNQQWNEWADGAGIAPDQRNTWRDVDGDGMNNLMEYSLGTDPLAPDAWSPALNPAAGTIGWTVNLRENWSQFVTIGAQSNYGTGAWSNLPSNSFTALTPTRLEFRAPVTPGKKFFRMKFDLPP